ncbi:MAG TPA: Tat pathway signal protein [Microvirga sp.]|nr:Tat pathway signal protein [Microvirga sp.]
MTRMGTFGMMRLVLAVCLASLLPAPASSQQSGLRIELNKLEPIGENCRAFFLIDNHQGKDWRSIKLDLFALDPDGVAAKRLAVEVGPVPVKKTLIKLFDFQGLACPRVGRILLNDVVSCDGDVSAREACLSAIETASKVSSVPFDK